MGKGVTSDLSLTFGGVGEVTLYYFCFFKFFMGGLCVCWNFICWC